VRLGPASGRPAFPILPAMSADANRLRPIETTERLRGVDIARGVALLGILFVNARIFFQPLALAIGQVDDPARTGLDRLAAAVVDAFCTAKFIGLFSLLFGFGLALQFDRAAAAGRSALGFGFRRLAVLLGFGLVHAWFVWCGDVLVLYAILGVPMLFLVRCRAATIGWTAVGVMAVSLVLNGAWYALQWAMAEFGWVPPPAADPPTDLRGIRAMISSSFDPASATWIAAEIAAFRDGPFGDALLFRVVTWLMALVVSSFSYGWHALAMMLVGAWAYRSGLFAFDASARRRRIAALCLALGLPVSLVGAAVPWFLGFGEPGSVALSLGLVQVGACLLPLGYAAAIVEWGPRLPPALAVPLERTGRMAITVYLAESLAMTALASWWGLGWFGSVHDAGMFALALAVWSALALGATAWLALFPIGPVEWLWRRLSYGSRPRPAPAIR